MSKNSFSGLYLQLTGHPLFFSFVTYTPQTREQMIACGDLGIEEEYFNPVIFDFLLFVSERVLNMQPSWNSPIQYDDIVIVCSRKRGGGSQHEYLLCVIKNDWNEPKQAMLEQIIATLSQQAWNGSFLN